jgi:hypothetical protein
MLTATLLLSKEGKLFCCMHFNLEQVKIFRAPTVQTNIAYYVVKIG